MRILVLTNVFGGLYYFRKELLERLSLCNDLTCALPDDPRKGWFDEIGCKFIEVPTDRRGTNPLTDYKLYKTYRRLIRGVIPDVVLTYTIKPNIYGGLAANREGVPCIANITGLGTGILRKTVLKRVIIYLYRRALRNAACVFFQNAENQRFFIDEEIVTGKNRLIPGSGVNLERYRFEEYPENGNFIRFLFIGRVMKEKSMSSCI